MTPKILFVTGTDTNVGKTIVCGLLAEGFTKLGKKTAYWKPVQTGSEADAAIITARFSESIKILPTSYHFPLAASPDQASAAARQPDISLRTLAAAFADLATTSEVLIIEGAGGLLVPLNQKGETWLDLLNEWKIPVVIVARSGLGTLNHAALTLNSLQLHGMQVQSVILNGTKHLDNEKSLRRDFPTLRFTSLLPLDLADADARNTVSRQIIEGIGEFYPQAEKLPQPSVTWHPYTPQTGEIAPLILTRAKGSWLYTDQGEALFDGISSWWVNTLGHGRREIAETLFRQQQNLDHVIFAGATHAPAEELATQIIAQTQGKFSRVFFSDNGSTAVEIALKIAYQFWQNQGITARNKFLSLASSYHGDTFGAMALGKIKGFHDVFSQLFFPTLTVTPATTHASIHCPFGKDDCEQRLRELEKTFDENHLELCAVIAEPMLQGAGGMLVQELRWLKKLNQLCQQYQIPLIFDEVFTGMGRVGDLFCFRRFDLTPDLVCLGKGLTGGTLPLALTLANERIYQAFVTDDLSKTLLHGHSYTANPISCAVALKSLEIYEQENLPANALRYEKRFAQWLDDLPPTLPIKNPRCLGAMLAFECGSDKTSNYFSRDHHASIRTLARELKLFLRPLGNTIYLVPPLATPPDEIEFALAQMRKLVELLG